MLPSPCTVLGNHDLHLHLHLHLLAVAAGVADLHHSDTLDEILNAPDRTELLDWLRHQRMIHVQGNHVLLHAGLMPAWSVQQAQELAHEVERNLQGKDYATFLEKMYGNTPHHWDDTYAYLHSAGRNAIQVQRRGGGYTRRLFTLV